jgi:hypothetical protein
MSTLSGLSNSHSVTFFNLFVGKSETLALAGALRNQVDEIISTALKADVLDFTLNEFVFPD